MDTTPNQFQWPAGKRAALSLTFDDARPSQIDRGIPILDAHGVKGTFYVSFGAMEKRLDDWKRAAANGHEIGNHTVSHPCCANFGWTAGKALEDFTLGRMENELTQANATIQQKLGIQAKTFAYPCGQKYVGRGLQTQSYVPLVAKHFLAGRGFRDESPNDPVVCDLAQLGGVDADSQTYDQLHPWIEKAIARGGWLIFVGHEIGPMHFQTIVSESLEAICRLAQEPSNGIWIDTVAAIAAHVRDGQKLGQPLEA